MARTPRRSERTRSRVQVRIKEAGAAGSITGFTRDISRDGLFVQTHQPLRPGTEVEVELLYRTHTTEVEGVVVHAARAPSHLQGLETSGMGIRVRRPQAPSPVSGGTARDGLRVAPQTEAMIFFGSERHQVALHDLSASGAALIAGERLPEIAFLRVRLRLTRASDPVELEAVPVRQEPWEEGTLLAVRFLAPPPDVVARIDAFSARRAPARAAEEE
jgi:PilZ domain